MNVSAFLPLKGQSERIPAKNTKVLGGKPLFFHILESLLNAKRVSQVVIDTDSDYIFKLTQESFSSVQVKMRPDKILGAKVPMSPLLRWNCQYFESEHFIQVHATTPFLKPETIDRAIDQYFSKLGTHDSLFGVTPYQTRFYDSEFKPINHNPEVMVPSQDMPPIFEDNSCLYLISKEKFLATDKRIGDNPQLFGISKIESIDLDEKEDFIIAEAVWEHLNKGWNYGTEQAQDRDRIMDNAP